MKIQFPSRIELLIPDCGLLTDVIFKRKISSINLPFFFLCNFAAYRLQSYRGEEIKDTRMIKIPDYGAMASRYPENDFLRLNRHQYIIWWQSQSSQMARLNKLDQSIK